MALTRAARNCRCILLVEEDAETRRVLVRALEGEGYRVNAASSADDAAGMLGRMFEPPAALLVDLPIASLRAVEAARRLRGASGFAEVFPILVLADEYQPDLEGIEKWVGPRDVVIHLESFVQLRVVIGAMLDQPMERSG